MTGKNLQGKNLKFAVAMEIIVGLCFIGIIAFFAVRKFKKINEKNDCCK